MSTATYEVKVTYDDDTTYTLYLINGQLQTTEPIMLKKQISLLPNINQIVNWCKDCCAKKIELTRVRG